MAVNGEDRQAAAAAPEEEEIVVEMPVKPAPSPPVKVSSAGGRAGASAWEMAVLPLSMVAVQAFTVVMLLLSKLALNTDMRPHRLPQPRHHCRPRTTRLLLQEVRLCLSSGPPC
jgi:hypothetical protein